MLTFSYRFNLLHISQKIKGKVETRIELKGTPKTSQINDTLDYGLSRVYYVVYSVI